MLTKKFLKELLSKEDKLLSEIIRELSEDDLYWQPGPESNSIGWIIWHMARVEDMWIQFFSKREMEKWESENWHSTFNLPTRQTGFKHIPEQLSSFPHIDINTLIEYRKSVRGSTSEFIDKLQEEDFNENPWSDKPDMWWHNFTIINMLQQLLGELYQHIGQIAYIKGLRKGFASVPEDYATPQMRYQK